MSLETGNVASNYYIRTMYGASDDLDAGFVMEFGDLSTSGFLTKYSFLNNDSGLSFAVELSLGGAGNSQYTYVGPIVSLHFGEGLEFFAGARYVVLDLGAEDYDVGDNLGGVIYNSDEVTYLYTSSGLNVWFAKNYGMSIYITYYMGEDVSVDGAPFGASFIANF